MFRWTNVCLDGILENPLQKYGKNTTYVAIFWHKMCIFEYIFIAKSDITLSYRQ